MDAKLAAACIHISTQQQVALTTTANAMLYILSSNVKGTDHMQTSLCLEADWMWLLFCQPTQ